MAFSEDESAMLELIATHAHTEDPPEARVLAGDIAWINERLARTERGGRDGLPELESEEMYRLYNTLSLLLSHFAGQPLLGASVRDVIRWQAVAAFTEAANLAPGRYAAAVMWDSRASEFDDLGAAVIADLDRRWAKHLRELAQGD